jgi:hypothetical protein
LGLTPVSYNGDMNSDDTTNPPADLSALTYTELLAVGRCCTGLLPDDRYPGGMMMVGHHSVGGQHRHKDCTNPVEVELRRRANESVRAYAATRGNVRIAWPMSAK